MNNNIFFPKATDSWGEITAYVVGGKNPFGIKKVNGKWVEVKVGEPIVTWEIPGFGTGEFKLCSPS